MGTSVMKSSSVVAALVMVVVVLLGTCASVANGALRVENTRVGDRASDITVLHPPGCCNYCPPGKICPTVCVVCRDVVVKSGKVVTLESKVGPYPLQSLNIGADGKVYCVPEENLQHLTRTALLQLIVIVGNASEHCENEIALRVIRTISASTSSTAASPNHALHFSVHRHAHKQGTLTQDGGSNWWQSVQESLVHRAKFSNFPQRRRSTVEICPAICEVCKEVVVESGKMVTLEPNVGPYPLEHLNIQVQD